MSSLYVIDGHSLMFRAIYAPMPNLTSPYGEPTKATFAFFKMLIRLVKTRKPDYLCMAVDVPRSTLERRKVFPKYKANRGQPEEDTIIQIKRMKELTRLLGVPILYCEGYEADDVIASLAKQFRDQVDSVWVVTRDKDLNQIVTHKVRIYDCQEDVEIDSARILKKWGLSPAEFLQMQALAGDSGDGVPGIRGIGPDKATKLIKRYGTALALVDNVEQLTPAVRKVVNRADIELMLSLVRLQDDLDIGCSLEDFRFTGLNFKRAGPLLSRLGFRREAE